MNATTNRITISGHGYSTGDGCLRWRSSGLTSGTTYYVAVVDAADLVVDHQGNALAGQLFR